MAKTPVDVRDRARPEQGRDVEAPERSSGSFDEASLTARHVLALQRGAGNAAVARYLRGGGDPRTLSRRAAPPSAPREKRTQHTEGVIMSTRGSHLHVGRSERSRVIGTKLTYHGRIFVVDRNAGYGFSLVTTLDGREGYVLTAVVRTDLPCPGARLYYVHTGRTALGIVGDEFGEDQTDGADGRYFVNVLAYMNPKALVKPGVRDWHDVQFKAKTFIYLPTVQYAKSLRKVVDGGSRTGGLVAKLKRAWRTAKRTVGKAVDLTIGAAAFHYGVLKGVVLTAKDILEGLGSLVGAVIKTFKKSFRETLGDIRALYKEVAEIDISGTMGVLWKQFTGRWNAEDPWDRWSFRGEVFGRVIAEVLLTVLSGGVAAILSGTSKFTRLTAVVSRLRSVQKLELAVRKNSPRLPNQLAALRTKRRPKRPKGAAEVERKSRAKNRKKPGSGTPEASLKGLKNFNPAQRKLAKARIVEARKAGGREFRADQTQVGWGPPGNPGPRLGNNRPDLQYLDDSGRCHIIEYDAYGSNRGRQHLRDALANDPKAIIELWQEVRVKRSGKWARTYVKVFP